MAGDTEFFVDGGTLAPDSPSYVTRPADEELLSSLMYGEFCYVLTPRQMGKSSLMVRTAQRLRERGVRTVIVDLNSIGVVSSDQWYLGLLSRIRRQLGLTLEPLEWWQKQPWSASQNFIAFLRDVALTECSEPIVIFIDEIDSTLALDFRDDFFAAIRAIYNGRANEPRYKQLTFAFLGVATPTELIQDRKRTPFSLGRRIDLQEFSYQDARPLLEHLTEIFPDHAAAILHRIFHWTDGHPYLTQTLCKEAAAHPTTYWDDRAVDRLVAQTLLSDEGNKDTNLVFIQERILSGSGRERRAMLRLYHQIYSGKAVADNDRSVTQNRLELYGLIKVRENRLDVRNEIYRNVFDADWISALSQNVPQSRFAIFTDWIGTLTMPQRWLAIASGIIVLLAVVAFAIQNGRPGASANQPAGTSDVENVQNTQDSNELPAHQAQAAPEVAQLSAQAVVTSTVEGDQAAANQKPQADYDQALLEVIKRAPGYAGYDANPNIAQRMDITDSLPALGQLLFFDPILSGDRNISCATCHHPRYAMADGRVLPIGTGGYGLGPQRVFTPTVAVNDALASGGYVPRNSPSMINAALYSVHMWDGRIEDAYDTPVEQLSDEKLLENMPLLVPLVNKYVMAGVTLGDQEPAAIVDELLGRLQDNPDYVALFQDAFESDDVPANELITLQRLTAALFAFERSLIFVEAPWDRYVEYINTSTDQRDAIADQRDALSEQQKRGALLFFGKTKPAINCAECHKGDHFSNFKTYNLLVPQLGPGAGHGTGKEDWGQGSITGAEADRCAFRTPSLRNVTLTAPYFHDGAYATLEAAIRHHLDPEQSFKNYDVSAQNIPTELQPVQPMESCLDAWRKHKDASTPKGELTDNEIADLVEFLTSLTVPAAERLEYLIPASVPSGLPLEPQPRALENAMAKSVPTQLVGIDPSLSHSLVPMGKLLAPEDAYGKGDLFGADEQQEVALQHLGFLQKGLAGNDMAEVRRHTEHVINILVGIGDENFKDHNLDDSIECPGDKVGVRNYLRQVQETSESVLLTLESNPESNELRLQIEQIVTLSQKAHTLLLTTVDQALPILNVGTAAEAKPLAQELGDQLDALTAAIDEIMVEVQPLLESMKMRTVSETRRLGVHFSAPQQNERVTSPFVVVMAPGGLIVEPAGEIRDGAGHFHLLIDTDFVQPGALIPVDDAHRHFGHGQMTTTLSLEPGVHTLRLQFANGEHFALDGEQHQNAITITVATDSADRIHVPAGEFTMGADAGYSIPVDDEFWIMRTEVTYRQYVACIEAKACTEPHNDYRWRDQAYADHPVTRIDWQQANAYADWIGGRLPTEAEWEKACRGEDARLYPWGNDPPNAQLANYDDMEGDTKPVGAYPDGASPYGLLDMSGNVWEWTSSLDADYPYRADDGREDRHAEGNRIRRGGSYFYTDAALPCSFRHGVAPESANDDTGLRVVFDQPVGDGGRTQR